MNVYPRIAGPELGRRRAIALRVPRRLLVDTETVKGSA